ncbi:hypothetical protein EON79_05665 [bacterium]|nr:MAG: hypothetical protein EON79_05665 [bacterium]
MICVYCATPGASQDHFCGECGWPLKQPSPYGGTDLTLPVARWADSPLRDAEGRALAYDRADPETGRARIHGEEPGARDKIPDFPNAKGPAGRRAGEILATSAARTGTSIECGPIQGAGFGAGRLVWGDGVSLYVWNLKNELPVRSDLAAHRPMGPEAVLVSGWRTYLTTAQGWAVHHGLSGQVNTLASNRPTAVAAIPQGAVAAFGREAIRISSNGTRETLPSLPFDAVALAAEGDLLVAFGAAGEIARWEGPSWRTVHNGIASSTLRQGWIVNGRAGAMVSIDVQTRVFYEPDPGRTPLEPIAIEADGDVSVVAGRDRWDDHRVLSFVGGSNPRVIVYAPGDSSAPIPRPLDTMQLGTTVTIVRRSPEGAGAITVAYTDPGGAGQVKFEPARPGPVAVPLPSTAALAANASDVRLFPTLEGLAMLAHDGHRAVLNLIPYPR